MRSHLHLQMWDQYLTDLNTAWDLENIHHDLVEQKQASHFYTSLWDQQLLTLNEAWHVDSAYALTPPTSVAAKLLFPFKKMVLRWMQPVLDAIVQRQNDVNARLVQSCNAVVETVERDAIQQIEAQRTFNSRVVQAINGIGELIDLEFTRLRMEYETGMWTFERRKEALEVDQVLLNQKLEQVLAILREQPPTGDTSAAPTTLPDSDRQLDYAYLLFEHQYRGGEATLKQQQTKYLQYFQGCSAVLDVGCGRGEFLELLQEHEIPAYGLDMNRTMVEYCRKKGLRAEEQEVLEHLGALDDNSLGGIFIAQMVEHCASSALLQLLQRCFQKLQPQAYLVLETQNPTSLYALSHFHRDLSHDKPIHPDALEFLTKTSGFQETSITYESPFPSKHQLQELQELPEADEALRGNILRLNHNIKQLNSMLYGFLDYAVIARKTAPFS